jgi:hypothetical protein
VKPASPQFNKFPLCIDVISYIPMKISSEIIENSFEES